MPKVNKLDNLQPDYTTRKFGKKLSKGVYVNHLRAIDVQIVSAPTAEEFKRTIAVFIGNTWNDKITTEFTQEEQNKLVEGVFAGNLLPTAQEVINIVWSVSGLNLIGTTHLLRHRAFSFSAMVHGDRSPQDDAILVPPGIMCQPEYFSRFKQIVEDARQLYVDMLNDGVNCLDARAILPRCLTHFYMVRCNIRDLIGYIKLRRCEAFQTQEDNIVALQLWAAIVRLYPFLKKCIDFTEPDHFYVKQCSAGQRSIFPPNERNNKFLWSKEQFYQDKGRDEFPGSGTYLKLRDKLLKQIADVPETPCKIWTGSLTTAGYAGNVSKAVRGKSKELCAYQIACEQQNGPRPVGAQASHLCHNKLCYEPSHLIWETAKQNQHRVPADVVRKQRKQQGATTKLTFAAKGKEWNKARTDKAKATLGFEGRSAAMKKVQANLGVHGRKAVAAKARATLGDEKFKASRKKAGKTLQSRSKGYFTSKTDPLPYRVRGLKDGKYYTVGKFKTAAEATAAYRKLKGIE